VKRREFIALLGSAAVTWPLAAHAQQGERVRRIGVLMSYAADDPAGQTRLLTFAQALAQLGWTEGRNVRIDIRWGAGSPERIRSYAAELVAGRRTGGRWLRRNPRPAGRQRYWFYVV
jgi:putative ABC transport system substrate-binding protein